jgi:hypothetical protein
MRSVYRILVEKSKWKIPLGDRRLNGMIILKWFLKKWVRGVNWFQDTVHWQALVDMTVRYHAS